MRQFCFIAVLMCSLPLFSQTYNMPVSGSVSTCSGNFYDAGGLAGQYANNETRVFTICPATPGTRIRVSFTAFNTENNADFLQIFDGSSTSSPSLGVLAGTPSVPFVAEATTGNTGGCLTFRFTSDGSNRRAGWEAAITCFLPCQTINANLVSLSPAPAADGIIRICPGQSVNFAGSGTFSSDGSGAAYSWSVGTVATLNGTTADYTFTTPGSYPVNLFITDANGCHNNNYFNQVIQVATSPVITTSATPASVCDNQSSTLSADVTMTPYAANCTPGVSGTTFLPDGSGVSYTTAIATDCYPTGSTITSVTDFVSVCLTLEHSYLGDLNIRFICPNGQSMLLKSYADGGGGRFLGAPLDDPATGPGVGRDYCFTPGASLLLVSGMTSNAGTPSLPSINAGNYRSTEPFNNLIGCPLNGNWMIQVTDNLAQDNGYIFNWDFNLSPALSANSSFTPGIVSQGWDAAPHLTSISPVAATVDNPSVGAPCYNYTLTDNFGCAYSTLECITVTPGITPSFAAIGSVCQGNPAPVLSTTSTNGFTGTWAPAVSTATPGATTYTFTPDAGLCATTTTLVLTVDPRITPQFNAIAPLCQASAAPVLATTSTNGIPGTWLPVVTTASAGTITYTFTPEAGQCAAVSYLPLTVTAPVIPVFTPLTACQGDAAPVLASVPANDPGITGSWSPAALSTASPGNVSATFTPTTGLCATSATVSLTINAPVTPVFSPITAVCQGDAAPVLPVNSDNAYSGSWSSAVSTATVGTTTYTFTPAAGPCAIPTTLSITVNSPVLPLFATIAPVCEGTAAPVLPAQSTNNYTGDWLPAVSTVTPGTTTYTFTPVGGQCAMPATLAITVNPLIIPAFNPVAPVCQGATVPAFSTSSTNGITGSWLPAVSSATAGTVTYTFTPETGQCAATATVSLVVGPPASPVFNALNPVCQYSPAPVLPVVSANGVPGSWLPAVSTAAAGTTTYTFTPAAGQCATTGTINLLVNAPAVPSFDPLVSVCQGDTAPSMPAGSTNGISGSWSPAVSTVSAGSTNYLFTAAPGECATTAQLNLVVNAPVLPDFTAIPAVCAGDVAPVLPVASTNNITGTWMPVVSTTVAGVTIYTFTPAAGQCALTANLSLTVNALPVVTVPSVTTCSNVPVTLTAGGADAYSWSPAIGLDGTIGSQVTATVSATTVYTITGTTLGCSGSASVTVTIAPGLTINVSPASAAICAGSSVELTASGAANYNWTSAPGLSAASGSVVTASPSSTTTYTIDGETNGCLGTTTITVTVNPVPVVSAVASTTLCAGETLKLDAVKVQGGTYNWTGPNGFAASVEDPIIPAAGIDRSGTYAVSVTTNDCISPVATTDVLVNPVPVVVAPPMTTCPDVPVTLIASGADTYTWTPSNGSGSAKGANVHKTFNSEVTYIVEGTTNGCTGTTTTTVTITPGLTITVSPASATICSGSSVSLSASGAMDYNWTPATGGPSTSGSVINASPLVTTTYTIDGNSSGCLGSATITVIVNDPVVPVFNAVNPVCQDDVLPALPLSSVNGYTGTWLPALSTVTPGTVTYTFTPAAGLCALTATTTITVNAPVTPVFSPLNGVCQGSIAPVLPMTSTNNYSGSWLPAVSTAVSGTAIYTFTPLAGQCTTSGNLSLTVYSLPVVTAGTDQVVCQGTAVTLSGNGATTYVWDNGGVDRTPFTPAVGKVTFTVTGTDMNGCKNTDEAAVTVNANPTVVAGIDHTLCAGTSVIVTATGTMSYSWTGNITNGVAFTPSSTQNYVVTGTDNNGCSDTDDLTVSVEALPVPAFISTNPEGCSPVSFSVSNTTPTTVSLCEWSFSDGTTATGSGMVKHTFTDPGCYDVTLTVTSLNGCKGTATRENVVCVHPNPVASFTANPSEMTITSTNCKMDNTSEGGSLYHWGFGDGEHSTAFNPAHLYPEGVAGDYQVELTVISEFGCKDQAYYTVHVKDELVYFIPNTFTPDGDQYNASFQPVFSSGFDPSDYSLQVFNRWGETLFESKNAEIGWDGTYQGSVVQDGTYSWRIGVKSNTDDERRVIVGHVNVVK